MSQVSQIGHKGMEDWEIYEAGKDGFRRGWKNIPPYSIAALTRPFKQPTAACIWQEGWLHAKAKETTNYSSPGLLTDACQRVRVHEASGGVL